MTLYEVYKFGYFILIVTPVMLISDVLHPLNCVNTSLAGQALFTTIILHIYIYIRKLVLLYANFKHIQFVRESVVVFIITTL